MRRLRRPLLLGGMTALTLVLAFVLRDVAQRMVIVPLAYVWWLGSLIYLVIPQFIKWSVLVLFVCVALLWQLLPEQRYAQHQEDPPRRIPGPVELLAVWIYKAGGSNYYKWQLAHRLGRTARQLQVLRGREGPARLPTAAIGKYLDAGIDHSFVEYAGVQNRFERRRATPLDIDPSEAVDYLESQMETNRGPHAHSL